MKHAKLFLIMFVIALSFVVASCMTVPAQGSATVPSSTSKPTASEGNLTVEQSMAELAYKLLPFIDVNQPKPSVAVMNFSFETSNPSLENYISGLVFEKLFATGKLKLIERENIDKVLSEQKFQLSGNVDDDSAKSIGKIVGVDYVCYGNIAELGDVLRVSGKMVDVLSGEVVSMGSVSLVKDQTLNSLLSNQRGATPSTASPTSSQEKMTNFWKVEKNVNEFDNVISYIFTLESTKGYIIYIDCSIYADSSKSTVFGGIKWGQYYYYVKEYEIKGDDGKITKIKFPDTYYLKRGSKELDFMGTDMPRNFLEILLNNNKLSIRASGEVRTFSTYGLAETIASVGLKWADFDAAMKNREF